MEAPLWTALLGLLYVPTAVTWTVSQSPPGVSLTTLNSSAQILCSTTRPDPDGLTLLGRFHGNREVVHLAFQKGAMKSPTVNAGFAGRVAVTSDLQPSGGGGRVSLRLSLLGLTDTDLYECSWIYFDSLTWDLQRLRSNGTIVIVRDRDPAGDCYTQVTDLVLIVLSLSGFLLMALFITGALIRNRTRVRRHGTAYTVTPTRPLPAPPQQRDPRLNNWSFSR